MKQETLDELRREAGELDAHYKRMGTIEPADYLMANPQFNYLQSIAIKYVSRYAEKNGREDLLKAKKAIDMLISWHDEEGW